MASPNPVLILADIQTSLSAIKLGAASSSTTVYKSSITTVATVPSTWTWTTVAEYARPLIGVIPGIERQVNQPANIKRCVLRYDLIVLADAIDGASKMTLMENIEDDVVAALEGGDNGVNTRRNGAATMTTIVEVDREYLADPTQGAMRFGVEVVYFRTTGTS